MIQLRIRTEYTFGKTYAPISRVVERLKELGCSAAGIVDVDSTWGHVAWMKACKAAGIRPLLGVDLTVSDDERQTRMWFLARNARGLSELYRCASLGFRQPLPTKYGSVPRLHRKDVETMSDDVLKFAGEVMDGDFLHRVRATVDMNPSSRVMNSVKTNLAAQHNLRMVTTSLNEYVAQEDRDTFELIVNNGLRQSAQWILPEIGSGLVAKEIADSIEDYEMPKAAMIRFPGAKEGDLEKICRAGIKFRKLGGKKWTKQYEARLMYELDLIKQKDFEHYFLIVADMVQYAKSVMLVGPSRGSAAGSLVCYLARITELDPIPHDLFFERFIDITRTDLPDIDLDFPDDKRQLVFEYMAKKYGNASVAHIGTVSRFKPKSALIQVCKALSISPSATSAVKIAMIERSSADSRANNCLEDTFKTTGPGQEFIRQYPAAMAATLLEGHASHTGVHAAGLLVTNEPITTFATVTAEGIAQIEKDGAESLGMLKIDVLGLRTLGILEDTSLNIDWYSLKFDDQATYDIFDMQKLCGIFQFEGDAMRAVSKDMGSFTSLADIDAVTALARPGPFGGGVTHKFLERRGGKEYQAIHPLVEKHMKDTFGLPIYQEQVLSIVREIGKFDWKETSTIRKAMSKRMGKEFFDTYWQKFKKGAAEQGIPENEAWQTWEMINSMGAWGMNRSHTRSYAVISYWTAWLKAHHPLEFAAAALRSAKDEDSAINLLREMVSREGISFVPFDLQKSEISWSVKDETLYGGFKSLKGIGDSKAETLVAARNDGKLTPKQLEQITTAQNVFADLFPFERLYGDWYKNPDAHGIAGELYKISDIEESPPHKHERVFLGEILKKSSRNINEDVLVKRRGGKVEDPPLDMLDLVLRDDTGQIWGRVGRYDFQRIGKELLETVPEGSHLMIRAVFYNGIRFAFIKKWRKLK